MIPTILKTHDLITNDTKTEEYIIPKPPPLSSPPLTLEELLKHKENTICWSYAGSLASCKLLGSLLDTYQDFTRRKHLALNT